VVQVSLPELEEWLKQETDKPFLIDVREPHEYEAFNVGGQNIPFGDLPDQLPQLPTGGTIVFCCATGQRSSAAAAWLQQTGFTGDIINLRGGVFG
jgi:adenylyltransferase/sulfurtransferase